MLKPIIIFSRYNYISYVLQIKIFIPRYTAAVAVSWSPSSFLIQATYLLYSDTTYLQQTAQTDGARPGIEDGQRLMITLS